MEIIIIGITSYLIGSIPFGFILTKIFLKKDIRNIGSGNIGTTNALRTGNKLVGYSTLVLDILKAVLPVLYVKFNYSDYIFIASLSAFLGHVFPIWLKFKGGKGVATYIGFIVGIDYILGVFFILVWLIIAIIKKYSSLASLIALLSIPILSYLLSHEFYVYSILILLSIIIIIKHFSNIKRLLNKSENKITL